MSRYDAVVHVGLSAGAAASAFIVPDLATLNFIASCAAGAYSSFSFGDKVEPRSKMFNLFIACIIMGASLTTLTNAGITHFVHMTMLPGTKCAMGAFVSCLTRFWLPSLIENIRSGNWLNWIPFLRNRKES